MARSKHHTPSNFATFGSVRLTRFPELTYQSRGDHWRILDAGSGATPPPGIGRQYATETELLADLDRFACGYGCNPDYTAKDDPLRRLKLLLDGLIRGEIETYAATVGGTEPFRASANKLSAYRTVMAQVRLIVTGSTGGMWPDGYETPPGE